MKKIGIYNCVYCGAPLFCSETKYNSVTGWPSFFATVEREAVNEDDDNWFFLQRTEVRSATCNDHLGHIFPDGPKPSGLRYRMNSRALKFDPKPDKK